MFGPCGLAARVATHPSPPSQRPRHEPCRRTLLTDSRCTVVRGKLIVLGVAPGRILLSGWGTNRRAPGVASRPSVSESRPLHHCGRRGISDSAVVLQRGGVAVECLLVWADCLRAGCGNSGLCERRTRRCCSFPPFLPVLSFILLSFILLFYLSKHREAFYSPRTPAQYSTHSSIHSGSELRPLDRDATSITFGSASKTEIK